MNIKELIKSRRTIRKFEQKPISCEQLGAYIDAGRVAPSARNLQPLKYIAVQSSNMREKLFPLLKWAGYLDGYTPKADEMPMAYIVVCVDKDICKGAAELDVGAAVENIILAALSDNVGACWIGSVDRQKTAELLEIEESLSVSCVVALGYPKESPREVEVTDNIKYYLDEDTLCVPKRSIDQVLIKTV